MIKKRQFLIQLIVLSMLMVLLLTSCGKDKNDTGNGGSSGNPDIVATDEPNIDDENKPTDGEDKEDGKSDSSSIQINSEIPSELSDIAIRFTEDIKSSNYSDILSFAYLPSDLSTADTLGLANLDNTVVGNYIANTEYKELAKYDFKDIIVKEVYGNELSKTVLISFDTNETDTDIASSDINTADIRLNIISDSSNTWKVILDNLVVKDYSVVIPIDTELKLNGTVLDKSLSIQSNTSDKVVYTFPYVAYSNLVFEYNSGLYGDISLTVNPSSENNKTNPYKLYYELSESESTEVLEHIRNSWNGIVKDLTAGNSDISQYFDNSLYSADGVSNIASKMVTSFGNNAMDVEMIDIKKRDDTSASGAEHLIFMTGKDSVLVNYTCKIQFTRDGNTEETSFPAWMILTKTNNIWKISGNSESAFIGYLNPTDKYW